MRGNRAEPEDHKPKVALRGLREAAPVKGLEWDRPLLRVSIEREAEPVSKDPFRGWEECRPHKGRHRRSAPCLTVSEKRSNIEFSVAALCLLTQIPAEGQTKRIGLRMVYDRKTGTLAVIPTPEEKGRFRMSVTYGRNAKFGGTHVVRWMAERGFGEGKYPAEWDEERGALVVGRSS